MRRAAPLLRVLLAVLLASPLTAWAAHPSLRCSLSPPVAVLGHALQWTVRARDLPAMPMLGASSLGPQWLLQQQDGERAADGPRHSAQLLRLRLYPLAAGTLRLPELRAGSQRCPASSVRVLAAPPGAPARYIAARIGNDRPLVGQAVRVQLDVESAGGLDWSDVEARCDAGLLRPLSSLVARVDADGRRIEVQRWTWSFTPLRSGPVTVRFSLLRATRFGELLVYAAPILRVAVGARPAYWSDDAPLGRARLLAQPAPAVLRLGAAGVLRASLSGVQVGRQALLRWLARVPAPPGMQLYPARLHLDAASARRLNPRWDIELPFRIRAAGRLAYPRLRLLYLDPRRGAPALASAAWGQVRVHDPRPLHVLLAVAGVGGLASALALLRLGVLALRAALCRARWRRLARRGDVAALLRLWRRARRRGDAHALTLDAWVRARQRACGDVLPDPSLERLLAAARRQLYGPQAAASGS